MNNWDIVVDGLGKLESPCFDPAGNLYFSDIADDTVRRVDGAGALSVVVRDRPHVGGLTPHADGGLLASGRTIAVLHGGTERVLLDPDGGYGFNDLGTDAHGNVYVGKLAEMPTIDPPAISGSLWRLGTDGSTRHLYDGIQLTNGIALAPDGRSIYHNDSLAHVTWVSDVRPDGAVSGRRVLHDFGKKIPDGLAVDVEGCIWVALIGAGEIVRVTPDGVTDQVLKTPMRFVSALCFGGSDRREVFVTTFGQPYDPGRTGTVLATRVDVAGAAITPARV